MWPLQITKIVIYAYTNRTHKNMFVKSDLFISEIIRFSHQVIIYWSETDIQGESSGIRKEMTAEGLVG